MKYQVLKNGKKIEVEVEKIEYKKCCGIVTIDNKEYAFGSSGSNKFAVKVGGTKLLELCNSEIGKEEIYVIDYSYKLIEDIENVIKKGEKSSAEYYKNKGDF
jgi:hypothetical protein